MCVQYWAAHRLFSSGLECSVCVPLPVSLTVLWDWWKACVPLITRPVELLAGRVSDRCMHTHPPTHTHTHKHKHYGTHKYIMLWPCLVCTIHQIMSVSFTFTSVLYFNVMLPFELYFGEQLRVQTVEVKSKLYTGPQSVMLMKRFRVNRGEERPTL